MDQEKIGKFIAERRKMQTLTQMQLAERLGVSDRAVSKWERGKCMPDVSIMQELCQVLDISVSDLLCGEVVTVDNYNKEMEKQLIELAKQKEEADKRLLAMEWIVAILSCIVLLVPALIAALVPMDAPLTYIVAFSGFIPGIVGFGFAIKIEQVAGYYQCTLCQNKYVPTFQAVTFAPHLGRTRYMRCPCCGKKSWQKKVVRKD